MGIIRGGLVVIASVLLFVLFVAGNLFLTFGLSLDFETVKPEIAAVVTEMAEDQFGLSEKINEVYPMMVLYCENNSEFVFSEAGETFVIPCSVILESPEAIIEHGTKSMIEEVYYDEYDCSFLECLTETGEPFFLISKKAQEYFLNKFYLVLAISIVLIGLMILLVEKKSNLPILIGILLSVSSLIFVKLDSLFSFSSENSYLQFFTIFFTKSTEVFIYSFLIGLSIFIIGIILKLFTVGFKISDLIEKFKSKKDKGVSKKEAKGIVKEEVSKEKGK